MKIVAKCSAFVSLSYQVHDKVCNLLPLNILCWDSCINKVWYFDNFSDILFIMAIKVNVLFS